MPGENHDVLFRLRPLDGGGVRCVANPVHRHISVKACLLTQSAEGVPQPLSRERRPVVAEVHEVSSDIVLHPVLQQLPAAIPEDAHSGSLFFLPAEDHDTGLAVSPVFIGQDTLIHRYADEFIRGRVFSLRDWMLSCLMASGALLVGFLAALVQRRLIFVAFGVILVGLAITGWFAFSRGQGTSVSQNNT